MKKRCLSMVLCIALALSLLPLSVFAATQYTVTFDKNDPNSVINVVKRSIPSPQTVNSGERAVKPSVTPTSADYVFDGWYRDTDCTKAWNFSTATVTESTTLYAKWIPKPTYTITFEVDGGSQRDPVSGHEGEVIHLDDFAPVKDGYAFAGWYADSKLTTPVSTVTLSESITVYAKWSTDAYTLHFATNGGSAILDITKLNGSEVDLTSFRPTKSGSTFMGWFDETYSMQISSVKLTKDTTVYALWAEAAGKKTLSFETNGGSTVKSVTADSGSQLSLSKYTTDKAGSEFTGWYSDRELTQRISSVKLTANTTIYAGWLENTETKTLTFDTNGGSSILSIAKPLGSVIDLREYEPTKDSMGFAGWYADSVLSKEITSVTLTKDTTVYAKWSSDVRALTFDTNGGSAIPSERKASGTKVDLTRYEPTREGYAFVGWYADANLTKAVTSLTLQKDTTIYAKWSTAACTLTFDTNGGSAISSVTKVPGYTVDLAAYTPTKSGNSFAGWYSDEALTSPVTSVTLGKDTTVYAKWSTEGYTLSFFSNGGSKIDPVSAVSGAFLDLSDYVPVREGYTFGGWYQDTTSETPITGIALTQNTLLYAKWLENETPDGSYTLTFAANGGADLSAVTEASGFTVDLKGYVPAREGYTFDGWYLDEELTHVVTLLTLTKDTTVYAKWKDGTTPPSQIAFEDVKSSQYFYDAVVWAVSKDITSGIDRTHFAPKDNCTRAQTVTFLWRAAGCPEPASVEHPPFLDVNRNAYYFKAVLWAVESGITTGTSSYTFSPNEVVTRAQTVTFLYRFANGETPEISNPFEDIHNTDYFYPAVLWAYQNKIASGVESNLFAPEENCLRNQTVTFLYRCINQ